MKPMRVLNCTKRQREAIFAIADEVGFPVFPATRKMTEYDAYPHIAISSGEIAGTTDSSLIEAVSFSEFITELLKYEKPKVWASKESTKYDSVKFNNGETCYRFFVTGNTRNPKLTYEVEE